MLYFNINVTVTGPEEATSSAQNERTDKAPPACTGLELRRSYQNDVELWSNLTNLASKNRDSALLVRLEGEVRKAASSLLDYKTCGPSSLGCALVQLDKSYAVDKSLRLESDLSAFLDHTWDKSHAAEAFIAVFHTKHDKIAELEFLAHAHGHTMLRHVKLDHNEQNMIVGQKSGNYNMNQISCSFRPA